MFSKCIFILSLSLIYTCLIALDVRIRKALLCALRNTVRKYDERLNKEKEAA